MTQDNPANMDTANPPRRYRVITDYQAAYPDPFSVSAGETFHVSAKIDSWNNNPDWLWIWCTDQRGKSGWTPKNIITFNSDGTTGTTRSTYTAAELTVTAGDVLTATQEESGWVWCTNHEENSGWVPLDHLTLLA